jgi:spore germination cell wall hydrolase CwlJ-like protein
MFHQPVDNQSKVKRPAPKQAVKRRVFGFREILLVALAFLLLALLPSSAQWAWSVPGNKLSDDRLIGAAERPDQNFAGSAFYFLDPDMDAPASDKLAHSNVMPTNAALDAAMPLDAMPASVTPGTDMLNPQYAKLASTVPGFGGVAKPFYLQPGSVDHSRALKCLTDAIYYEAANEPDAGQRAVAQVIINRMRHPTYPNTICGVIYQGSERATGCQFSYSCDGSMARTPARPAWLRAQRVALDMLAGSVYAPVGMATHYHATYVYPYWAPSLDFIATIGAHRFYNWKGSAGRPSAFFRSHAGREPFPGPKPRAWTPASRTAPLLDPIQLQKQYEREYAAARVKAEADAIAAAKSSIANTATGPAAYRDIQPNYRPTKAPVYAAPDYSREAKAKGGDATYGGGNLPSNGNIKPEFQASGTWKAAPSGI